MKIIVNSNEFKDALGTLATYVKHFKDIGISNEILIKTSCDHIMLIATDLDISVRVIISGVVKQSGSCLLQKKELNWVKYLTDKSFSLEAGNNGCLINGNCNFNLNVLNSEGYPDINFNTTKLIYGLTFYDFAIMLRNVSVSNGDSIYKGLSLQSRTKGKLELAMTDNIKFSYTSCMLPDINLKKPVFISDTCLERVRDLIESKQGAVFVTEDCLYLITDNMKIRINYSNLKFPNYSFLFDMINNNNRLVFNNTSLARQLKRHVEFLKDNECSTIFEFSTDELILISTVKNPNIIEVDTRRTIINLDIKVPMKVKSIILNPKYVLDLLFNLGTTVELHFTEDRKTCCLHDLSSGISLFHFLAAKKF